MKEKLKNTLIHLYRNLSIKHKLLLLFCIQIIIPLLFISYMNYQKSSEIIKNKSMLYSQDILKMIELRINDLYDNLNTVSMDLLYDNSIYNILNYSSEEASDSTYFTRLGDVKNTLRKSALSRNEIQSIALVSKDKKFYTFDVNSSKANIEEMMPYDTLLYQARKADGKILWYLDKSNNGTNIYVIRLINNRDNFSEIGLMVILIKRESLEDVYNNLSEDAVQNIAITSSKGDIIVSNSKNKLDFIKNINSHSGSIIDKKNNTLISYTTINNLNWKVISNISLKTLYSEISTLKKWIYIWLIGALLILSLLTILTAVDIIDPINKLVVGMKKVEKGEKHEAINLNRNDELGYLSTTFNTMSERIDYLVNRIYTEQLTRKEAEIKALQAQINPHFLFNTLENINWMAQLSGVPEISETVTSLANLMDASIGRDDKLITIKDEFIYIKNYISILKKRYEDRLSFTITSTTEILSVKIPRLLIQPLVENAVYHGIEKVPRNGNIELKTYKSNKDVSIEVIDNGIGMKPEELKILNERLSETTSNYIRNENNHNFKSIGLENVNRRIKLFYGDSYGLRIESSYDEYTKVIVNIPANGA